MINGPNTLIIGVLIKVKLNVSTYLDESALAFFKKINNCQNFSAFNDFVVRFNKKHVNISQPSTSEFVNIKMEICGQLMQHFHKKLEIGQKLKLSKPLLLAGLRDGLPS